MWDLSHLLLCCLCSITAVFVALKNKMDLAIGVALGSSIQVGPPCMQSLPGWPFEYKEAVLQRTRAPHDSWPIGSVSVVGGAHDKG